MLYRVAATAGAVRLSIRLSHSDTVSRKLNLDHAVINRPISYLSRIPEIIEHVVKPFV